ncbi:MAG: SGNH/GDSL hydrolase family protein [Treponema sp.]|uniref:SGNH/GDSL hydrolase family protein n=1 Tax=Treponema sp. TaxID=166 RepID=UPI00298E8EBA|nr:SGNH/GDSL hydrolase family protein [Treponema sp.]MDD5811804.1 SGNH/GDSL hydrolase family protein [Treponema sp.]
MSSIFEAAMLVCFGFSWPMNVRKAIKAKSAKGMSLAFILLIIVGYIAGITAKLMNHQINYVLAVYILNLVIVFTNLVVYFRNRALDRRSESMKMDVKKSDGESVVLLGGSLDKEIPVAEVAQSFNFNFKMYNRSKYGLSLKDARKTYLESVEPMNPEAVIIHLGKEDVEMFKNNSADFDVKYLELLSSIRHQNKDRRIALVSLEEESKVEVEMNRHIKAIAESEKCEFVNMDRAKLWDTEKTKEVTAFMYELGFDSQLKVKKPLGDISKVLYSYAYQNGLFNEVENVQAV